MRVEIEVQDAAEFRSLFKAEWDESKHPRGDGGKFGDGGFERVSPDGDFSKDDNFYYHITTTRAIADINRSGLIPRTGGGTMTPGFYAEYSKGKVFFSEASGVSFWRDRIQEHLEHQFDNPPKIAIVRFPKEWVSNVQEDELGFKDSRSGSYFSTEVIRIPSPARKAYNLDQPRDDQGRFGDGGGASNDIKGDARDDLVDAMAVYDAESDRIEDGDPEGHKDHEAALTAVADRAATGGALTLNDKESKAVAWLVNGMDGYEHLKGALK